MDTRNMKRSAKRSSIRQRDKLNAAVMEGFEALDRGDLAKCAPDQIAEDVLKRFQNGEL